jgi:hypothetical protein
MVVEPPSLPREDCRRILRFHDDLRERGRLDQSPLFIDLQNNQCQEYLQKPHPQAAKGLV